MAERAPRIALGLLVVQGLFVGVWAAAWPRSFYDDFPGGGRAWVAADGPYNEHLVRDFGDLNLALAVVTLVALVTATRAVALAAALGWIVYQAPHLVYHLRHLDLYDTGDKVANVSTLVLALALPIVVLVGVGGSGLATLRKHVLSRTDERARPRAGPPNVGSGRDGGRGIR